MQAKQGWVELLECGLAHPDVLAAAGVADRSGLALGAGLDRGVMLRKGIDDIRLLRSTDARVSRQMLDLSPYRSVSAQPPATRDMSVAAPAGTNDEELGDLIRCALDTGAREWVEEVTVLSRTPASELPRPARKRIRIAYGEENLLGGCRSATRPARWAKPRRTCYATASTLLCITAACTNGRAVRTRDQSRPNHDESTMVRLATACVLVSRGLDGEGNICGVLLSRSLSRVAGHERRAGQFRSGPTSSLSSIRSIGHGGDEEVLSGPGLGLAFPRASTVVVFSGAVRLGEPARGRVDALVAIVPADAIPG